MAFFLLLISLIPYYVAQILILNFWYNQHNFYYLSCFLKHIRNTYKLQQKKFKIFNRVPPI